jgi:hypothetical protein
MKHDGPVNGALLTKDDTVNWYQIASDYSGAIAIVTTSSKQGGFIGSGG